MMDEIYMDDLLSDEELMLGLSEREELLEMLIFRHQKKLMNFFVKMGVSNDAEDMAQETFIKIYNYKNKYEKKAKFTTFMYTIARNILTDHWRKKARIKKFLAWFELENKKEESLEIRNKEMEDKALLALEELSIEMREIVTLKIFQGLKYSEIANIVQLPLGTIKSRMHYALEKMRLKIKP